MEDSLLIPAGDKLKAYACVRSISEKGVRPIVASEYDQMPLFSSRYCSEQVKLSSSPIDLPSYKDELLSIATREDVASIVPVRECDTYLLAKYADEFEDHVSLVTPDLETLQRVHDRYQLAKEAGRAGVPVAETCLLTDVDEWNRDVVIKSRYNLLTPDYLDSAASDSITEKKRIRFIPSGESPEVPAVREEMEHDPIVQQYVPQRKKILHCSIWSHGEPLATYQHEQLRQNSWVGGGGVYRRSVFSQTVEEVAHDLLSHLDWHGFACIEFLQDEETGEWKFLEVNPRIWQSMPEAVRAGADFPYYYWLRANGEPERIDSDYETGVACHNAYGELSHLLSIFRDKTPFEEPPSAARTCYDIVTSCVGNPRFEYFRRDDPHLIKRLIRETLSSGVTTSRQFDSGGTPIERASIARPGQ